MMTTWVIPPKRACSCKTQLTFRSLGSSGRAHLGNVYPDPSTCHALPHHVSITTQKQTASSRQRIGSDIAIHARTGRAHVGSGMGASEHMNVTPVLQWIITQSLTHLPRIPPPSSSRPYGQDLLISLNNSITSINHPSCPLHETRLFARQKAHYISYLPDRPFPLHR